MKIAKIALIIIMVMAVAGLAYAAEKENFTPANKGTGKTGVSAASQYKLSAKAENGIKNMLFGWTEIPLTIVEVTADSKNPFWGLTAGTFKGISKALPKTASGVADIIYYPIDDQGKGSAGTSQSGAQIK